MNLPNHDALYVVSDLHMGGQPGLQILRETDRLARYITWISVQNPRGKTALVSNGDVIDSLAEEITGYIAVDEASSMVQRILDDPSFTQVWDALAGLVRKERRRP